jgi:hypothetical protein
MNGSHACRADHGYRKPSHETQHGLNRHVADGQDEQVKYRLYIDEVGNADLGSSDNPNHRFLSLTGVIMDLGYVKAVLHPQMESLKARYFGHHPDDPVIFHRKEMMNAKGPFRPLADSDNRARFDNALLELLDSWDYTVISVCIDKKKHKETYTTWRYDPYHYCLAVLIERYVFLLNRVQAVGDAMAESRGGKEDMRLKAAFSRLWEKGTEYMAPERIQEVFTSKELKVKAKVNNIPGLQLADLVAHPSRNEILAAQGHLDRPIAPFAQKIVRILARKYYQHEGIIEGRGRKFL